MASTIWMAGCAGTQAIAPPPQQAFPASAQHAVYVADPDAQASIVSDIGPLEGGRFRWTGKAPTVKLALDKTDGIRLRARFWLPDAAFEKTGPIEIAYLVNGNIVARIRYDKSGEHQFDKPIDASLLKTGPHNEVRLELDKTYDTNGAHLGIALAELGFAD